MGIPTAEQLSEGKQVLNYGMESLKFSLNGQVYEFPMQMQELFDDGWELTRAAQVALETIPPYTMVTSTKLEKKETDQYSSGKCIFTLSNEIAANVKIGEMEIETLKMYKEDHATLILPKGITWDSTFEEVVEAYQPRPESVIEQPDCLSLTFFNTQKRRSVVINFDVETRTISDVKFY